MPITKKRTFTYLVIFIVIAAAVATIDVTASINIDDYGQFKMMRVVLYIFFSASTVGVLALCLSILFSYLFEFVRLILGREVADEYAASQPLRYLFWAELRQQLDNVSNGDEE